MDKIKIYINKIGQELRNDPKPFLIAGSALLASTFLITAAVTTLDKKSQIKPLAQSDQIMAQTLLPDDYLNPNSFYPKAEKEIVYIDPPAQPREMIDPRDMFLPLPNIGPDKMELMRLELMEKRRKMANVFKVENKPTNINYQRTPTKMVDVSAHDDYRSLGLEKNIPSYPVDLERVLTVTNIIPITLESGIRSDIGSQKVQAVVNQDVYGTHGRVVLIPRGTKAIGEYEPLEEPGDERLEIRWTRLERPDGIGIVMDAEGLDVQGQSGLSGEVDSRFKDRYGNALLLATLASAAQLSVGTDSEAQASAASNFSSEFSSVSAELVSQGFDLAPRIKIPSGTRMVISPLTDLFFREPELEEITVRPVEAEINTYDLAKTD